MNAQNSDHSHYSLSSGEFVHVLIQLAGSCANFVQHLQSRNRRGQAQEHVRMGPRTWAGVPRRLCYTH